MRFAAPGKSGPLFTYGGAGDSGYVHDGPFAVVDVETTGFSPANGDRVIEIAIARVDASGRVEDEYATLINAQGRDTGAVFVHGISNDAVRKSPLFADVADVADDILARLEGTVVVAHNAVFEERFLAAELRRAGIGVGPLPSLCSLCSLWFVQRTFRKGTDGWMSSLMARPPMSTGEIDDVAAEHYLEVLSEARPRHFLVRRATSSTSPQAGPSGWRPPA